MLDLCRSFFAHLDEQGVRYCHWKSNEHLDQALSGRTDLDILVHPQDQSALEDAILRYDIKLILSPANKQFPGLEDYLGFDQETGSFVHLHVHYRMVMGQKYIKNHHLPLEDLFFDNLIEKEGIKIPRPELELILLYIRGHIKADYESIIKHGIKGVVTDDYTAFPQDIESEFRHLIATSDMAEVEVLLELTGLPIAFDRMSTFCQRLVKNELKFHQIFTEQRYLLKALSPYRRAKSTLIYLSYFMFFLDTFTIVNRFKVYKRKRLVGEGKVIAFIGADGSGKSTLTADISKWLSWKLTTNNYYYGIPKSRTAGVFSILSRALTKLNMKRLVHFSQSLFWLYVAKHRQKVSQATAYSKIDGELALTDRFPLENFWNMPEPMDGPRLLSESSGIHSLFSDRERVMYRSLYYPDLLIVLQVDLDVLRTRKPDLPSLADHTLKADAINGLDENLKNSCLIDANKSYEEVLIEVKRKIWSVL